jgi:hypothetical protein
MKGVAKTHRVSITGGFLARGFWLYIWEAKPAKGKPLYYVGRTGDSSSPNAQSPFVRMGQHLGKLKNASMLRNHLKKAKVNPEDCQFLMIAHGPILTEAKPKTMKQHKVRRDRIAALEMALECSMRQAKYNVMNEVKCRAKVEPGLLTKVLRAFSRDFKGLKPPRADAKD